jgi:hypothetical protein
VAESMGGSLSVASRPGHGSTFTLSLRCAADAAPTAAPGDVQSPLFTTSLHPPRPSAG